VAILFIVFDIEVAFLYPWAVGFRTIGVVGFVSMMIFLAVLLVGLFYASRKRVFDWK
jgi:NADH-quinone oxidoreductase subunit A